MKTKIHLLRSKFAPPVSGRFLVPRARLNSRMSAARHARVVLVWAPAGFGKTSLMVQWMARLKEQGKPTAWLTIDEADNDPGRFLSYLIAAVYKADPTLDMEEPETGSPDGERLPMGTILRRLDCLSSSEVPITLFLDEFEALQSEEVLGAFQYLLLHLPAGLRVVLATRDIPKIALAKISARGNLLEIDADGLRFDYEETAQFVRKTQGLDVEDKEIAWLHDYTEGWIAGLQLTTLSASWREDPGNIRQRKAGSFQKIAEYLAEDVLAGQPEEVQSFLVQTSILDRLSGPLCDALTGRADGADTLNRIESANLFLMPLDEERRWFRYHSLFAKFLRSRLERGFRDRLSRLHQSASAWHAKDGDLQEAAKHSLAAEDPETAAELMERCAVSLLTEGYVATVAEWGGRLPQQVLRRHPSMRFAYCTALVLHGEFDRAARVLGSLDCGENRLAGLPHFQEHLIALQSLILLAQDRIGECERRIADVMERVEAGTFPKMPEGDALQFLIAGLLRIAGWTKLTLGKHDEAMKYLDLSHALDLEVSSLMGNVYDKYLKGRIEFARGRMQSALALCRSSMETTRTGPSRYFAGGTSAAVLQAEILYEMDELDEAKKLLSAYRPLLPLGLPVDERIVGYRTLARISFAKGDFAGAMKILDELEGFGAGAPSRDAASSRLEQAWLAIRQGDPKLAARILKNRDEREVWPKFQGRCMPANDQDTPEIAALRLGIAQGRSREVLETVKEGLRRAEDSGRFRQAMQTRILLAMAYEGNGNRRSALRTLREALVSAQNEGYVRSFADEGAAVVRLVRDLRNNAGNVEERGNGEISAEYLDRILQAAGDACRDAPIPEPAAGEPEALTRQEILILKKLATGLSNEALADRLCISKHTVRFHLRNIHAKLGASNRTEAVAIGRRFGIIP